MLDFGRSIQIDNKTNTIKCTLSISFVVLNKNRIKYSYLLTTIKIHFINFAKNHDCIGSDLHGGNFGMDKNGTPKLIDYSGFWS